ncbi:MAG: sigma-70 family RNA polymerase sigma factor [bacterium]|nr:sigma-70 family RNA polymerase sigma factor [bacterium]
MIERDQQARLSAGLRGGREERKRAAGELFEGTRASLWGIALRMTGRPDLAEDAVQETFVDVLRGADGFRGDARLTTWLYRIAVRAAARVSSRARHSAASLPEELALEGGEPPEALAQREGAARILTAMARLPAPQRAVLALAALDELPQTEIAAVLGLPPGTVYSRLHQARERMREALERGNS